MPGPRKKPCRICQQWFYPEARIGARQRACGKPECQTTRRQKTQADWRARNPSYGATYRLDHRHPPEPAPPTEPVRVPAPLDKLPWDVAKDQFGSKATDFIIVMCLVLLRSKKDQTARYPVDPTGVASNNPASPQKTSGQPPHTETRATTDAGTAGISSTGPPPGTPPGAPPGTPTAPHRLAG